ncbi:MAG: non-homologous end-joining DNA ligase [Archaeoglobaceae archaeon]
MTDWFERRIKPMLAVRGKPFDSEEHVYELKFDGTRCLAFVDVEKRRLRLQNRRLLEIAYRYPELDFFNFLDRSAVLDGEIVVLRDGKPDFYLLQQREHVVGRSRIKILSKLYPAVYMAFDTLYVDGDGWIMDEELSERKKLLERVSNDTKRVAKVEFIEKNGIALYEKVIELGFEGVVAKRKASRYQPGKRSEDWVKIKKSRTVDCVIVGWLEGEGWRSGKFGSLVLALYDGLKLVHVGQVGTGFDAEFIDRFYEALREIEVEEPHFEEEFKRPVHWVKPVYVCEVEFLETTKDGKLRAPVFRRLRFDKSPQECTIDQLTE